MAAKYVLAVVGAVFLLMGVLRSRRLGAWHPQARTWLLIAAIFGAVSLWLFTRG
jgi:hypothetical protein